MSEYGLESRRQGPEMAWAGEGKAARPRHLRRLGRALDILERKMLTGQSGTKAVPSMRGQE